MRIQTVFIVGSGLMGSGIAQVCAQAGIEVFMNDINQEILDRAMTNIDWSVNKLIDKGKLKEKGEAIAARIHTTMDFASSEQVDLVIEAVFERPELKKEIFKQLDAMCRAETILGTNSSAISITDLAAETKRGKKVLGLHFFNPVPMMDVVEVIRGFETSEETMQAGVDFVKTLGKKPIRVECDIPGFLLNRINLIGYVEAIHLLEQGVGTVEDIDEGVRLAFGRRMGPFETGDLVGLDVSSGALSAIYDETKDTRYYPPQLLRRKVRSGELGRKTGRGWYSYYPNGTREK